MQVIGIDTSWAGSAGYCIAEQPGDNIIACGTIPPFHHKGRVDDDVQQARAFYWVAAVREVLDRYPSIPIFSETGRAWLLAKGHKGRRPVNTASLFSAGYSQIAIWLAAEGRTVRSVDPNKVRHAFGVTAYARQFSAGGFWEARWKEAMERYGDEVKAKVCLALAARMEQAHGVWTWPANEHEGDAAIIALSCADYAMRGQIGELIS